MERRDVVVLQIDLDEGLPVVVALMNFDVIEHEVREVEMLLGAKPRQIARDIAPLRFEQQPLPVLQRCSAEIQAGVVREMRGTEELAVQIVRPAMQGADDVLRLAAAVEHDGLAVAAYVRQQFNL